MFDVAVIGAGIAGAAIAFELSKYNLSVCLLEKENDVSLGTTKANSAIIHAGYDPNPGTLMAKYNAQGNRLTEEYCKEYGVPYLNTGSLVLALCEQDKLHIKKLYEQGIRNGVNGLEILNSEQVAKVEPNVSKDTLLALRAKTAGIVSPWELTISLAENAVSNGVKLFLNYEVAKIERSEKYFVLNDDLRTKYIINCAGVFSAKIAKLAEDYSFEINPVKGAYFLLDKSENKTVNHVIFGCPTEKGKGVLIAKTIHGNLLTGPNAQEIKNFNDTSTAKEYFNEIEINAKKLIPCINLRKNIRHFAGIRANASTGDFVIGKTDFSGFINVAGIKSPGLSCALAIAKDIPNYLDGLDLTLKKEFTKLYAKPKFTSLPESEQQKLIAKNSAYAQVICRCETITLGEILDSFNRPIPPVSIDGVKRRALAGLGRCQGGFCSPRVHEILAGELKKDMTQILMDKQNSYILTSKTKEGNINES